RENPRCLCGEERDYSKPFDALQISLPEKHPEPRLQITRFANKYLKYKGNKLIKNRWNLLRKMRISGQTGLCRAIAPRSTA
ncbi:hypothetical protein ACMHYO_15775, partial [Allopusillimonas ginsengisoli]|uniref:hypothetical protein n=1 Tax=Allopusillimonas ginsengisoli TaxID=453575 RepID=UPI0039C44424